MSGESGHVCRQVTGQRVRPEPVNEKSFVENVTGFINEVVPQTYHNPSHYEGKERITWVKFEECDVNDLSQFKDRIECNGNSPPFLLIIGYVNGVQAWVIPSNGEATEVISWRQGPVRALKVLVSPNTNDGTLDQHSLKRPIFAICDAASPGPRFHSVSFISLKTGEQIKAIKFESAVQDIYSNRNVVVISFIDRLAVLEAATLERIFTISHCFPCSGPILNPIALGDRWLAYADIKLHTAHQSCGGVVVEGSSSYKTTVLYAAKSFTKGLKELGESVALNFMGQRGSPLQPQPTATPQKTPGIVTIIDTQRVNNDHVNLSNGMTSGLVAHFMAHQGAPIVALEFDPSGMLLATADKLGHTFHIFRIQPHSISSTMAAVHHLYILHRGDTTAKVMDVSFSLDSRWVAFSTHRGTTHVYPITPYGGSVGVRTHTSVCVVNRLSRFQRSAGLDDAPSSGRNSPILSTSPNTAKFAFEPSPNLAYHNPSYPPYPIPTHVKPLAQLRQPLLQNLVESIVPGPSPGHSPPCGNKPPRTVGPEDIVKVSSVFGASRGWLAGSPTAPKEPKQKAVDSLFVMAYHGNLIEYYLEAKVSSTIPHDRITENSPIELEVHATAQWSLVRESTSREIRPPLSLDSPLMIPLSNQKFSSPTSSFENDDPEEKWMAQVEIYTHAGPHRRLWMGPQFVFKTLPGTGHLAGGSQVSSAEQSLEFPHQRSSPVNMPGVKCGSSSNLAVLIEARSISGSHDQSPRFLERYSSESDTCDHDIVLNKLKCELADAMLDTPIALSDSRKSSKQRIYSSSEHVDDGGFDMSDVMDISCDPPGPGSGRPTPSPRNTYLGARTEQEIQSITSKLHNVAVTSRPNAVLDAQPFWGSRTPSLEECRGMTSSAEELSLTLTNVSSTETKDSASDFAWKPIDPPASSKDKGCRGDGHCPPVERPKPVDARDKTSVSSTTKNGIQMKENFFEESGESPFRDTSFQGKPSWAKIAEKKDCKTSPVQQESYWGHKDDDFPPVSDISYSSKSTSKQVSSKGGTGASGTTSEEDLWPARENKKDRKKRRKKNKDVTSDQEDQGPSNSVVSENASAWKWGETRTEEPPQTLEGLEIDVDHFHTAEEFQEMEFHDPIEDEVSSRKESMLTSIHDENDLARALEEASSDESVPVRATSSRTKEANEMFPFRDSSSEDEDIKFRRRADLSSLVSKMPQEDDDDRETSGDDRKTTSESDVTASPNPRATLNSKNKKKKKKKKQ